MTGLARTKLDLAAVLPPESLEKVLERSEERQLFDLHAIDEVLARYAHHPGAGSLWRALSIYTDDPAVTRSLLALVRAAGLPEPAMNFVVAGFELDAYWERERFAVEMIRVTGPRLRREPEAVIRRLGEHLARRRRELS